MKSSENLRSLIEDKQVEIAKLPKKNDAIFTNRKPDFKKLDKLAGYTVFLIAHDYSAKTPVMWNTLYEKLGINIRNVTLVVAPENLALVVKTLKKDPKYLGGNFGVGLKEKIVQLLD